MALTLCSLKDGELKLPQATLGLRDAGGHFAKFIAGGSFSEVSEGRIQLSSRTVVVTHRVPVH